MNRLFNGRALQTDLVRADRTVPIAGLAGSRDPGAAPSTERPAAETTQAHNLQQHRSAGICGTVWLGAKHSERLDDRWHRTGFRLYWRWKSKSLGGRPKLSADIRQLVREISLANPLSGAPRIHGELLKLGIDVGQTTIAKYMARNGRPPAGIENVLRNHPDGIASMDLCVVPTISFQLLYALLILKHVRREILCLAELNIPARNG